MSRLIPLAVILMAAAPGAAQVPPRLRLDSDRLQFDRVRFDAPIASEDTNRDEYNAYCDTLLHARQFSTDELIAGGNRFVTFRDLLDKQSGRGWQYELLTLRLNLKKCRPFPAPRPLAEQGVPTLYECWLFVPPTDNAVCVVVSELPPGVEPELNYPVARPVTVAGYFFKLIHYESQERDPERAGNFLTRRGPLLLGKSFELVAEPPAPPADPWGGVLIPVILGSLVLLGLTALGVTWFFRSGDRAVRAELAARRERNPFPTDQSFESPPPPGM